MRHNVVMGGFGGQGVKTIATLLGQAANAASLHASMYNIYGAAIRGGAIFCYCAISREPLVGAVVTTFPSAVLAMDQRTFETFEGVVTPGGTLVVNTSLVASTSARRDITTIYAPTSDIANELGDFKLCGMVGLGALVAAISVVSLEQLLACLEHTLPVSKRHLLAGNRAALERGAALAGAAHAPARLQPASKMQLGV